MAFKTIDEYINAFKLSNCIEQEIYLIRGVYSKFGEWGLKELALRSKRNIDEFYDCASLEWWDKNRNRARRQRKLIPHITAAESMDSVAASKKANPYKTKQRSDDYGQYRVVPTDVKPKVYSGGSCIPK